jgi:site-specific DNA-methyltransferase (adenine-specific)
MTITTKKLKDIIPYTQNAKKHDKKQIDNVAESIKQYGFVQPIVIDCDGVIVIGHCRALAAKQLGMDEVPCVCVDDLTPEQVRALRLVDNKTNESPWDIDLLALELDDLDLTGFDFDWGLPEAEEPEVEEDEAPDVDEINPPITKVGNIWQLGRHRLMCGDSTSIECVQELMGGDTSRYPSYRPTIWGRLHGQDQRCAKNRQ